MKRPCSALAFFLLATTLAPAQTAQPKDVREAAKGGADSIPKLTEYLASPLRDVRLEAARQIVNLGTARSLDPLITATRDNDPQIQMTAVEGMVNFYLPGYVETGISGALKRAGSGIKGHFTDTNDQVIDNYVVVRPEVIAAIGKVASGGSSMPARAAAARAAGVLRGKAAVPDLVEAVHSKDSTVMYESLVALVKIGDRSAGPRVQFLLRDLDSKVQIAAIEAASMLRNQEALPGLVSVLNSSSNAKVKRAALTAIAMLPDASSQPLFTRNLSDKDEHMRGAAAEGLGRLRLANSKPALEAAWKDESKASPRISIAFALVLLGNTSLTEFSPLQHLVNTLNSSANRDEALPLLIELARETPVREGLYSALGAATATRSEKTGIARALAQSGDKTSVPYLEKLSHDSDASVAEDGLRALRSLQARL
jgi:HEAT repeat protein